MHDVWSAFKQVELSSGTTLLGLMLRTSRSDGISLRYHCGLCSGDTDGSVGCVSTDP